jgi:hypothetical protein
VEVDTWGLYSRGGRRWTIPVMETSLHSHIAAIHIQERIAFAERERFAREVRGPRKPLRSFFRLPRRTAPTAHRTVGVGPA